MPYENHIRVAPGFRSRKPISPAADIMRVSDTGRRSGSYFIRCQVIFANFHFMTSTLSSSLIMRYDRSSRGNL